MYKFIYFSALFFLFSFSPITLTYTVAAPTPTAPAKITTTYTEPITGMEFIAIPGGTFIMGNNAEEQSRPEHNVTVKPFFLGRYEVTAEQYAKFCNSSGQQIPPDDGWSHIKNRPVVNVAWFNAVAFTVWLSEKTGKKFRLPSEAEWEYAARGGAATKFPWGDEIGKNNANCNGCGSLWDFKTTAPVGSFAPNGYGLYDMIGNVYEWTLDARHDGYEGAPQDGSAWTENGKLNEMVNRGGSWYQPVEEMTITRRCWDRLTKKRYEYGFRVLLEQ